MLSPNHPAKKRIIVAMSGGVDSSVAAFLLQEAGHEVSGVFMKNWQEENDDAHCPASIEMAEAQSVCDKLKINLQQVNFANEYWERVFSYFLDEYRAGRTPNPDILCNKEIKFRAFLDYAVTQGAELIATGHYVRSRQDQQNWQLLKGLDRQKDQSYFLYALSQEQLSRSVFPVGDLEKPAVRELAKKIGLRNYAKKDSTGICFIGERKFKNFLNEYLPAQAGVIETMTGEAIGQHDGLMFYTIGQRQGLKIGGKKGKAESPWYVVGKDLKRNVLTVTQGEHDPALYATELTAQSLHWIAGEPPEFSEQLLAKTRYRQADQVCYIHPLAEDRIRVRFAQPQRAITPGQSIVFYRDEICLGGGIITDK